MAKLDTGEIVLQLRFSPDGRLANVDLVGCETQHIATASAYLNAFLTVKLHAEIAQIQQRLQPGIMLPFNGKSQTSG